MNVNEFREALGRSPGRHLRFVLEGGRAVADHFHVTEVGRVEKRFVDCGGKRRSTVSCVLQTLVAGDVDHRLTTDKLAGIMGLVDQLDLPADAAVEVEHQERSISVDAVASAAERDGVLEFRLAPKQTACLAEDACGIGVGALPVVDDGCSGSTGCC